MRQAVNENRTVQLALVAILALAGGLLLLKVTKGSSSPTPAPAAGSSSTATAPTAPSTGTSPTSSTAGAPSTSGSTAVPVGFVPGPGLPKSLLPAYRHGDAIVLLVRRGGGIDDKLVHGSVERLNGDSRVKAYVTTAKHIARYAWLTQGVDVTELPALVVLKPRGLSGGTPTAAVSYGFRDSASVVQQVDDAFYRGPTRPYHP
jgi:hypothetical protein